MRQRCRNLHESIIDVNLPDPTVLRDDDGTYYMTGTENIRNLGLFSSPDLVDWTLTGTIFKDGDKRPDTAIWAPELCRIHGKYVRFYCSNPDAADTFKAYLGYAVADSVTGPWHDRGKLFDGYEAGCRNAIDPFYYQGNGSHYLFWGSTTNMFGMEIEVDGNIDITFDLRIDTADKFYYYVRKFVTEGLEHADHLGCNDIDIPLMRFGETLLCLAECYNELNRLDDAVATVNRIRRRAGAIELNTTAPHNGERKGGYAQTPAQRVQMGAFCRRHRVYARTALAHLERR